LRVFFVVLLVIVCISGIGYIFWKQELRFTKPTRKPENLKQVKVNDSINIDLVNKSKKPLFIHFYNYDCPCSRFNIKEFETMVRNFSDSIDFIAVVQSGDQSSNAEKLFKEKYDLGVKTIADKNGQIADALGIYSTPQAVIIKNNKIFYKGNYNKARFCTSRNTRFAEMALEAMIAGKQPPEMPLLAEIPYGCELPSNGNTNTRLGSIFNF